MDRKNVAAVVSLDGIDVTEIPRRHQRDARALPLQHRVQPDGRAVDEEIDRRSFGQEDVQSFDHSAGGVGGRGQDLSCKRLAARGILEHEIGKGSADVGRDAEAVLLVLCHRWFREDDRSSAATCRQPQLQRRQR